jgi:hypothetical protein
MHSCEIFNRGGEVAGLPDQDSESASPCHPQIVLLSQMSASTVAVVEKMGNIVASPRHHDWYPDIPTAIFRRRLLQKHYAEHLESRRP